MHLRVDNVSRMPTGLLMLQDRVPYVLGPRPRFVLDRVESGGHREVSYRVRSDLRGRYPLGPLQLRLTDPFGMCELTRSFTASDTLTVVPRIEPLPPVRLAGEASGHGESRTRALALAGEDDVIPRGYRHGDDLRRVHWRSTARYGELMVRREEQPHRARCTVLLDTRRTAYHGIGPDSAFEWAVTGAASVAVHMLERGYAVRLLTDTGACVPGRDGAGSSTGGGASGSAATRRRRPACCWTPSRSSTTPTAAGCRGRTTCCAAATRGCWWPSSATSTTSRPSWCGRMRQRAGRGGRLRHRRPGGRRTTDGVDGDGGRYRSRPDACCARPAGPCCRCGPATSSPTCGAGGPTGRRRRGRT